MGRPKKEDRQDPRYVPGAPDWDDLERWEGFDFEAHFEAVGRGEKSDDDHVLMVLRCYAIHGLDAPVSVLGEIHAGILAVLTEGVTWQEAFPLPWMPAPTAEEIHSAADLRRFKIGSAMYDRLGDFPPPPGAVNAALDQVMAQFGASRRDVQRAWKEFRERMWITSQRTGVKAEPDTPEPTNNLANDPFGIAPKRSDRKT
jgi:hypothetical protein